MQEVTRLLKLLSLEERIAYLNRFRQERERATVYREHPLVTKSRVKLLEIHRTISDVHDSTTNNLETAQFEYSAIKPLPVEMKDAQVGSQASVPLSTVAVEND